MADFRSVIRSNYFKVKDEEAFLDWADSLDLEVWEKNEDGENSFAISEGTEECVGWPNSVIDEFDGEEGEIDFKGDLAGHLKAGSVAVLMEVGNESLEYLLGHAVALNSKGESVVINLNDIYTAAAKLGDEITKAEY